MRELRMKVKHITEDNKKAQHFCWALWELLGSNQ